MMYAEMDPFAGPPSRRTALAGFAELSVLDRAECLVEVARDPHRDALERAQALTELPGFNWSLGLSTASSLAADPTPALRLAATTILQTHQVPERPAWDAVDPAAVDPVAGGRPAEEPDPVA